MKTCNETDSARFLLGEMSDLEITSFEDHLETCDACRQRLESQAADPSLWDTARELLLRTPQKSPDAGSAPDPEWMPDCTTAQVLSFVAPTDDPSMIGRVGPYEISALLGRGSAGIVLKGFDRALNRNVAIKVLDPALAGVGAARQRFAREARAMAAISHEHLVPVFEVNEHAGLPYFVMEYVPGGSLERRLRSQGPLEVLSVARIGQQVALALAAAHRQGLVHRDIKPGNILLDSGTDRVRVADFGLVRISNDVSCSRSGIVAGTPQYMAPEQVRGEICDAQSDLFSLGAVMYALCAGHPPFRADTIYGVMQRIAHGQPRSIREQNSNVPAWLEAFVFRLLEKERSARFESANEAAEILSHELAYLQNPRHSAAPRRDWIRTPTKPRGKLNPIRAGVVGALLLVMTGLGIWISGLMAPIRQTERKDKSQSGANLNPAPSSTFESTTEQRKPIPLWNQDGTGEVGHQIESLGKRWDQTEREENDLWNRDVRELSQSLWLLLQLEMNNVPVPDSQEVLPSTPPSKPEEERKE